MSRSELITGMDLASAGADAIRAEWDARLHDYQLARLLVDADQNWGPLNVASEAHEQARQVIVLKYGSWERAKVAGVQMTDTFEACQAVERKNLKMYCEPMWEASRALVKVPAPDLAALKIKVEVIDREEVWNDGTFDGDCWQIINDDAARLRGNV